jgi:radical SAM family uncharacterized protein
LSLSYEARLEQILSQVRRPGRYTGGEWNQIVKDSARVRIALAFPDVYEVGMSNLGLQILYEIINGQPDWAAERAFAPWTDMEALMRQEKMPLLSLETKRPLKEFAVVGFSLQYELTFTNVLNMLQLSGISLRSVDRAPDSPLVIAGGPGVFNPEPMAPFIDAFVVGEAEEVILDLLGAVDKGSGGSRTKDGRRRLLRELSELKGVYVPSLYPFKGYPLRAEDGRPVRVAKRVISGFDRLAIPKKPVVPFLETIHDRSVIEVMRGCTRGCRFCQAGIVYRPTRERSAASVAAGAARQLGATGHNEVSLASLSTTDHSELTELLSALGELEGPPCSVSLPSLRTDRFAVEVAAQLAKVKKTGLTFAPEAGTDRLRRVINKGVTEADLLGTAEKAFAAGWSRLKLYFMIGLPTETDEDVVGIAAMAQAVLRRAGEVMGAKAARRIKLVVSVSSFIPKPHSPFQWAGSLSLSEIERRQRLLRDHLPGRQIDLKWHDARSSLIEAALARGGREAAEAIERAFSSGARFDSWSDQFSFDLWVRAFAQAGIDLESTAEAKPVEQPLPWDHIDSGVAKSWLLEEYTKALSADETPDCRHHACSDCGVCGGGVKLEFAAGRKRRLNAQAPA